MRLNEDQRTCVGKWRSKPGDGFLGLMLHLAPSIRETFLCFSNIVRKYPSYFLKLTIQLLISGPFLLSNMQTFCTVVKIKQMKT
jgi:hypothetical protein